MVGTTRASAYAATKAGLAGLTRQLAAEYGADCPVVVVYRASQPEQLVLRGTLADIADKVEQAALRRAAVILVGRALGVRDASSCAQSHLYDPARTRV